MDTRGVVVGVIDVGGCSNIRSVTAAISRAGGRPVIVDDARSLGGLGALVLPGAGSFGSFVAAMAEDSWSERIREVVLGRNVSLLGICLGLQVLMEVGEEGGTEAGLGLLEGRTRRLRPGTNTLPHIGWNSVESVASGSMLMSGIGGGIDFYFLHSFCVDPVDTACVTAWATFGERFPAVIERGHVMGTQFHPEKSSRAGLRLFENFVSRVNE